MHENEILVFLFSTFVLLFLIIYRRQLSVLPAHHWLFFSFFVAWIAWLATNLEHILWPTVFNLIEHISYLLNGLFLLLWCWLATRKREAT